MDSNRSKNPCIQSAYVRLAGAVILQAVRDIYSGNKRLAHDARHWLKADGRMWIYVLSTDKLITEEVIQKIAQICTPENPYFNSTMFDQEFQARLVSIASVDQAGWGSFL